MSTPPVPGDFAPGEPVWVELCTTDPGRAETFYSQLLGWTVRHERLGSGVYRMCSIDGRDVAGIGDANSLRRDGIRGWITYFATEDIERTTRHAVDLGGRLVSEPRYLPAAGWGSVVLDPAGAAFGLYQGESRAGVETLNTEGALCWNELDTGDPQGSVAFYGTLLAFSTEERESSTARPYTVLLVGDEPVAGVLELESTWPNVIPPTWISYFAVASLTDSVTRVRELGGSVSVGPFDSAYGRLQLVRDPAGHTFCLIELGDGLRPDHRPTDRPESR